jgi:hypothetical protein
MTAATRWRKTHFLAVGLMAAGLVDIEQVIEAGRRRSAQQLPEAVFDRPMNGCAENQPKPILQATVRRSESSTSRGSCGKW